MLNLIKMIFYRISQNTIYLLMAVFIPPIVTIAAIIFTNNIEHNIRVVNLGQEKINIKNVAVVNMEKKPPASDLVQGKYDAIIYKNNGKYTFETLKGEEFEIGLDRVFNKGETVENAFKSKENRGVLSNLMGFLTMLILLLGSMLYKFFYQEKNGTDKRIAISNVGYWKYSLSHPIVVFLILFVPTSIILLIANTFLGLNTGVSNINLMFITFVLCMLAASFCFFIASIFKTEEHGSLVSSMVIMVTSLVSGSFIEISKAGFARSISYIFPQRYLIDYIIHLESGWNKGYVSMVVIIVICLAMLFAGAFINKRRINLM